MSPALVILSTSCFMALAMSGVLLVIARTYPKTIRGLNEWALGVLVIALSMPLFMARDVIPDLFSILLANLMLVVGLLIMNFGTRKFAETKSTLSRNWVALFVLAYVALFAWFTYVQPSVAMRVATLNLFTLVVVVDVLILVLKALPRTTGRHILVFSLTVLAGVRIFRLTGLVLGFDQPTGVFDVSASQLAFIALPSIMLPLGTISFIMLASEKLRQDLEFMSRHDDLTQCLNKKSAMDELKREIARADRYGNKLSVMLIDLDNFKHINDTHGHLAGDLVLVDFASKARLSLRETDQLTRFGGDEFLAILPDTDLEHAMRVADRLHAAGRKSRPLSWSVSIGISERLGKDDSLAALLARADEALYASKAFGRNQTQAYGRESQAQAAMPGRAVTEMRR